VHVSTQVSASMLDRVSGAKQNMKVFTKARLMWIFLIFHTAVSILSPASCRSLFHIGTHMYTPAHVNIGKRIALAKNLWSHDKIATPVRIQACFQTNSVHIHIDLRRTQA
jgi:hypothetical protein